MKKNNSFNPAPKRNSAPNMFDAIQAMNGADNYAPPSSNNPSSIEDELNKYSHMSEERLMQEMFALVDSGRKNGTLDNEKLEAFFNSASCMLNNEQVMKLRQLIDMAKNG